MLALTLAWGSISLSHEYTKWLVTWRERCNLIYLAENDQIIFFGHSGELCKVNCCFKSVQWMNALNISSCTHTSCTNCSTLASTFYSSSSSLFGHITRRKKPRRNNFVCVCLYSVCTIVLCFLSRRLTSNEASSALVGIRHYPSFPSRAFFTQSRGAFPVGSASQ